jgi:hypothetical protein
LITGQRELLDMEEIESTVLLSVLKRHLNKL